MQYCELHGENPSHSTSECFELNRRKKRAKELTNPQLSEKQRTVLYKDLNAFINAKVERAFKKKAKAKKEKKAKEIALKAFENFQNLEVKDSDDEDKKPAATKHASDKNDSDSSDTTDK